MLSTRFVASMSKSGIVAFGFLGFLLLAGSGCEDKAIGRPCDLQADAGPNQPTINPEALECPTRLCLQPAKSPDIAVVDTAPYCTAECSNDSDCDGEHRGSGMRDKRCKSGFVCGVAQEVGNLCCKKLCLCKDFVTLPLVPPIGCDKNTNKTCRNL